MRSNVDNYQNILDILFVSVVVIVHTPCVYIIITLDGLNDVGRGMYVYHAYSTTLHMCVLRVCVYYIT